MAGNIWRLALLSSFVFTTACDNFNARREGALEQYTPEEVFERGEFELQRGQPDDAAFFFGEIERLYPYSAVAQDALIRRAFSHYSDSDYGAAKQIAKQYLAFYPASEDAAYAQYLIALSSYDQIDEIGRDQDLTIEALQDLRAVIEVYPESEYARSAKLKFDLAFDHLAGKEMEVGRYYLSRGLA